MSQRIFFQKEGNVENNKTCFKTLEFANTSTLNQHGECMFDLSVNMQMQNKNSSN